MNQADRISHWQILEERTKALRDAEADLKGIREATKETRQRINSIKDDIAAALDEMDSPTPRLPIGGEA